MKASKSKGTLSGWKLAKSSLGEKRFFVGRADSFSRPLSEVKKKFTGTSVSSADSRPNTNAVVQETLVQRRVVANNAAATDSGVTTRSSIFTKDGIQIGAAG
jgi:hypothetical protein